MSYQEALTMQLGNYKSRISIRTGQIVEQLSMVLNIIEPDGLVQLSTTGPEQDGVTSPDVVVQHSADNTEATVTYEPTMEVQSAMGPNTGISGDLVVSYDVNHQNGIGDITVVEDTVIHSFSPKDLTALPKNIAFVIDVSGSMSGRKIEQTLEAMLTILDQLREEDMFNIILFQSSLRYWPTVNDVYEGELIGPIDTVSNPHPGSRGKRGLPFHGFASRRPMPLPTTRNPLAIYPIVPTVTRSPPHREPRPEPVTRSMTGMVRATARNIELAKQFTEAQIRANGGTNINSALLEACRILHSQRRSKGNLILFLTDGAPTSGVTDPRTIVENVAEAAQKTPTSGQIAVFSLAFGFSLNYDLLEMVSLSTEGRVKRIYAENDAADQLENFYQEISTPLMYDLDFIPDANIVDVETITQNKFPTYFQGCEILLAWRVKPELLSINLVQDRKKRDSEAPIIRCGVGLESYTTEPYEIYTVVGIDPSISLTVEDYKAREIDCLHTEDPVYDNVSNSTWVPQHFAERMWANLKIKNLLKISEVAKDVGKKGKAEKRAICLALKYHLVTPVTSFLIVQEQPPSSQNMGQRRSSSPATQGRQGWIGQAGPAGQRAYSYSQTSSRGQPGQAGPRGPRGPNGNAAPSGPSFVPAPWVPQHGQGGRSGQSGNPGPRRYFPSRTTMPPLPRWPWRWTSTTSHSTTTTSRAKSTTTADYKWPSSSTTTTRMRPSTTATEYKWPSSSSTTRTTMKPSSTTTTKTTTTTTMTTTATTTMIQTISNATIPSSSTTTTIMSPISATTDSDLDEQNKNDTEILCKDDECDKPAVTDNDGDDKNNEGGHYEALKQSGTQEEPKTYPVITDNGSNGMHISLYVLLQTAFILMASLSIV